VSRAVASCRFASMLPSRPSKTGGTPPAWASSIAQSDYGLLRLQQACQSLQVQNQLLHEVCLQWKQHHLCSPCCSLPGLQHHILCWPAPQLQHHLPSPLLARSTAPPPLSFAGHINTYNVITCSILPSSLDCILSMSWIESLLISSSFFNMNIM